MDKSFGSNAQPVMMTSAIAGSAPRWIHESRRPAILGLAGLAAVLNCAVHVSVAAKNTESAAAIGYLCFSLALFACSLAFWTRARSTHGVLRIRWSLVAAGTLASSIGFAPSFTEVIFNTGPARLLQTPCFNASEALFLLAIVLFSSGVGRSIVVVDMLQALLFVLLRFNLVYSPVTRDHFRLNHLLISQLMALFLFLVAMVACLGAASRSEGKLLRILAWFFGLRLISYFTADQVSYVWMHYVHSSLWDVLGTALLCGFALYLFITYRPIIAAQDHEIAHPPSMIVGSLMPSFLALVNLMLGLFVLRISVSLAAAAIAFSLVCYVLRTALLQAQTVKENALLESRNEQLEDLAVRDPLTGIGNRRSLAQVYSRLRASAGPECLSLLLMDIDRFKQANDSRGHLYGDKVLVILAKKLDGLAFDVAGGHCARLGGDEFALLLPRVSPEQASVLAEELRSRFNAHAFEAGGGTVSLSIGVASLENVCDFPLETLISSADNALYRAKLLGRNRVEAQPLWQATATEDGGAPAPPLELQEKAS